MNAEDFQQIFPLGEKNDAWTFCLYKENAGSSPCVFLNQSYQNGGRLLQEHLPFLSGKLERDGTFQTKVDSSSSAP